MLKPGMQKETWHAQSLAAVGLVGGRSVGADRLVGGGRLMDRQSVGRQWLVGE